MLGGHIHAWFMINAIQVADVGYLSRCAEVLLDAGHPAYHLGEFVGAELLVLQIGEVLARSASFPAGVIRRKAGKTTESSHASCGSYIRSNACIAAASCAWVPGIMQLSIRPQQRQRY